MDGIPELIWKDFPHPNGPNLGDREHVPFTGFETILARQILSCSVNMRRSQNVDYRMHCRQDVLLAQNVDDEYFSEEQCQPTMFFGSGRQTTVGTSGHKMLEMNDAFVDLPADDDASTSRTNPEPDVVQVKNPSFFSHRATVEELIASFRTHTIGPLAGVEIRNDSAADSRATPVIIISDEVSQRTLNCALEKWRVEQEERELEMRWRATKRLSENWLTKVELVREQHRAKLEKFAREKEKRKMKAGGSAMANLAGKGLTTSQGNNINRGVISKSQPHSSVLEPQSQPTAPPPHPELAHSQLLVNLPAWHLVPLVPQSANNPTFSHGSIHPHLPSSSLDPLPTPVCSDSRSSIQPPPREHASPASPNLPHAPYDPRTPALALEELAHIPLDPEQPNPISLPESVTDPFVPDLNNILVSEAMECVQQYLDVAEMSQSPLSPHCSSPSQDSMPSTPLPPSMSLHNSLPEIMPEGSSGDSSAHFVPQASESHTHHLLPEIIPEGSSGESSAHFIPQESESHTHHNFPNHNTLHVSSLSVNPTPMAQGISAITPAQATSSSEPTAEEKMMWHAWSLTQAPPATAADVILRNPQASHQSNLAPMLFKLFPKFKGNKHEAARVKVLTGSSTVHEGPHPSAALPMPLPGSANADSDRTRVSLPSDTFPRGEAGARAVIIIPHCSPSQPPTFVRSRSVGKHTVTHDPSIPHVPSFVPTLRPTPALKTQDLPPSLPQPWSHADSPMSPTPAHTTTTHLFSESNEPSNSTSPLYPFIPLGNRFFRMAKVGNTDVLRPSYWFEPDFMTTERIRNVVNLMERSGGWRRPERKMRVFGGDKKARGPDDLASFDLCFGY